MSTKKKKKAKKTKTRVSKSKAKKPLRSKAKRSASKRRRPTKASKLSVNKDQTRMEYILQGANLGSWDWCLESNDVQFDRLWCEMLGLDVNQIKHELKTWDDLVHPADKDQAYQDIKNYLDGKTEVYENVHRLKHIDGHWVWILDRGKVSEYSADGKPRRFTGTHFDITRFKEDQILSENIQKMAKIGGWELDLSNNKTIWTKETYDIHGIDPSTPTDKIMGIEFYAPHERDRIAEFVGACAEGKEFKETFEFIDANQKHKWVEVMGEPVYDANCKIYKIAGTFQDVTQKKKLDFEKDEAIQISKKKSDEIQYSLKQLEEAQSIAKVGSWYFELESKKLIWSKEHYRIFEIDYPQSSDKLFELYRSRVHPQDIPELDSIVDKKISEGLDFTFDHRVYLDDGKRIKYVRDVGKIIKDKNGKPYAVSGTCQDLTQTVDLQDQNRFILDVMDMGVWKFNPVNQDLFWDKSMYELYGLDPKKFSGHYEAWESSLTPEAKEQAVKDLGLALEGKKDFNTTFEILTPNGVRKQVGGKGVVVRNDKGEPIMMYGINWDRTKDVELENSLEIERSKSLHNSKLASLGEMSAGIAHEINNPLAVIAGTASILNKFKDNPEKFDSKIQSIKKSAGRIEKIVKGLRKFARTTDGAVFKNESIKEIIEESFVMVDAKATRSSVKLTKEIDSNSFVYCDGVEIEQVLVNLVNNAIDAVTNNRDKWVKIKCFEEGSEIVLQVIDSGKGISKDVKAKLFDPFFTTKAVGEGTGLGLSISKGILDQHGAKIDILEQSGHTCFEIRFCKSETGKGIDKDAA